jgi:hypothetical protein
MLPQRVRQGPHIGSKCRTRSFPVIDRLPIARLLRPELTHPQTR